MMIIKNIIKSDYSNNSCNFIGICYGVTRKRIITCHLQSGIKLQVGSYGTNIMRSHVIHY